MPPDSDSYKTDSSGDETVGKADDQTSQTVLGAFPPTGLLLLAIISIQLGAGLATHLFPVLGAEGTVAVRIIFSALLLGLAARGRIRTFGQTFVRNWKLLTVYGLCIATMNLFFYQSIALIPLGAAVAIEFAGPLGVAVLASRRLVHFAWVALAALGIVLLSPLAGANLDPLGTLFALLAGVSWAFFIILTRRVANRVPGSDGLAIGMTIAAISMIPFAVPIIPDLISTPMILLAAFGVALLSTTIPFTLEFEALKRMSTRTYGVVVSVEPAVAATMGALLLGERIGVQGMIAVVFIVVAAIGITMSDEGKTL